ncbi:MAG: DNA polymerase III subunit gamma/tau [Oscillospiraceae bacterium]|nr:DNA polymerase III subunit gamma/tau [Oscillospiraceae bacterium]
MYQALYRKYRPRCFHDVAGQEHVTETLRRQILRDRLSHAYLFVGTRGTGKTTCAKILARAINCQNPADGEPCNTCKSCIGIENGSILDVLELDAASNNGVDSVRALREEAIYTPASVKKRVYIIDEVHMLSSSAFNALLKILEEPPEHLVFILATTELHKVPATILSRCQRFSFKRLTAEVIAARLDLVANNEGLNLTSEAAGKLAALADGSMRDGLSLLDQCASDTLIDLQRVLDTVGLAGHQELTRLVGAVADRDISDALGCLDNLYCDGRDLTSLLGEIASLVRDMLIFKLSPGSPLLTSGFSVEELSMLSKKMPSERLLYCLETIKETLFSISRSGNVKLSVEMCLIRICDEQLSADASAMLARIAGLEVTGIENRRPRTVLAGKEPQAEGSENYPSMDMNMNMDKDKDTVPAQKPPEILVAPIEQEVVPKTPVAPIIQNNPETDESKGFWLDILEILKEDLAVYTLLSDSENVHAELRAGTLTIRASNLFTVNTIESKMFSEPLKAAASKALGREIIIRVEAGSSGGESNWDKLERLSAFNVIKFE